MKTMGGSGAEDLHPIRKLNQREAKLSEADGGELGLDAVVVASVPFEVSRLRREAQEAHKPSHAAQFLSQVGHCIDGRECGASWCALSRPVVDERGRRGEGTVRTRGLTEVN